ncbi:MAG: hypothetical protein COZ27_02300 [Candidatus Moranbacteria bacterium CG_4_10_14_3_um_filter_41_65]|nr:MAG: hypothetical protein AUK58_03095 [Candidatus Moranbacteria bacterium CG2_30_41_165]PIP25386.1 MAG: hypothetical protein COX32_03780 [Candidatus Moranbacteria bacterium CG23_combo_of_CG06-09_8_20_14_all_41_28]PIV86098.1 MAG: hypothetical protein COW50_03370 [Candidatus Moranbacteria bacterium CG17_big_fil_post_rev_8_21_14_2_50_41_107]PIW94308.1 MAG: hypothetical protein COZ86_01755 [Candidatus Moranbacteria bacterium CG_4_8_14_3_um_filter_41_13]PIX91537.1 MAG: hypothetical protein COZ27_
MLHINRHRQILFDIIRDVYQSHIGGYVGFKGGTMLYFFHELDRFSVDLDFDLFDISKKDQVYAELKEILRKYGKIKDEADKMHTIYFLLSYGEGEHGVKVEISKRLPEKKNEYEIRNFYGTDVATVKLDDAFANKLVAATERTRTANRDFYDIYFLFKKGIIPNEEIILARTGKDMSEYLSILRSFIEKNITETSVLEGIGDLVDNSRKDWLKKNLKKELLAQLDFSIIESKRGIR